LNRFVEINASHMKTPSIECDLYANRTMLAQYKASDVGEVTIIIQAYRNIKKLKRCVGSVLAYTKEIDYNLILINNGGDEEITEYFASIPYEKKKTIRITENRGVLFPLLAVNLTDIGQYMCFLASDIICTPHWMKNMLACMKSDPKIGIVNPISSNAGLHQNLDILFSSFDEMQETAERFNCSDPRRWEDRLWFDTLGTLYRKEAILAVGWPLPDLGYYAYGADLDLCFCIRRAGYRLVLAGDTWICHDDSHSHGDNALNPQIRDACKAAWKGFTGKYGIEEKDALNFWYPHLGYFPKPNVQGRARVLGVETKCGMPLLDIKSWLRRYDVFDTELSAVGEDPRYWPDLKSICNGEVVCGVAEEKLAELQPRYFDYVVSDLPINQYREPEKLVKRLFSVCKCGGYVICKLRNVANFRNFAYMLGKEDVYNEKMSWDISKTAAEKLLKKYGDIEATIRIDLGYDNCRKYLLEALRPRGGAEEERASRYAAALALERNMPPSDQKYIDDLLINEPSLEEWKKLVERMLVKDYLFVVKNK